MQDTLINLVDSRAKRNPEAPYAEYPASPTNFEGGYTKVSYHDFANAINGAAWWLEEKFGRSEEFQTLAYIGPNDLRYNVFVLAAIKAGYKVSSNFSARHSLEGFDTLT